MWQTAVLTFFAGVFAANGTPHFVKGITKEHFPSLLGTSPLINLVGGWAMYVLAALLIIAAGVTDHPVPAFAALSIGALLMGVFHAHIGAFGKRPPVKV
jgi:hypothetical protein